MNDKIMEIEAKIKELSKAVESIIEDLNFIKTELKSIRGCSREDEEKSREERVEERGNLREGKVDDEKMMKEERREERIKRSDIIICD